MSRKTADSGKKSGGAWVASGANTLATIADRKAEFRSLGDTWARILTILGGLADFERDLIRTRTGEGRARAVAKGVKMGRKPKQTPHQRREAINVASGTLPVSQ